MLDACKMHPADAPTPSACCHDGRKSLRYDEESVVRRGLNSGRVGDFDFLALRHRTLSPSEPPNFLTSTQELAVARLLITQNEWPKDIGARQARDRLRGKSSAHSTMAPPGASPGERCSELDLSNNRVSMILHHSIWDWDISTDTHIRI